MTGHFSFYLPLQSAPPRTCDGVRLGHEAGQTAADRVPVGVGGAAGAGAARGRRARVAGRAAHLGPRVRHQTLRTLAEWPSLLYTVCCDSSPKNIFANVQIFLNFGDYIFQNYSDMFF